MGLVLTVLLILQLFFSFSSVLSLNNRDEFHEELLVKPLASGHVYSYFQFTTLWRKPQNQNTCKLTQ